MPSWDTRRLIVALGLVLGGGALATWLALPPPPPPAAEIPRPEVVIAGEALAPEGDRVARALDLVRRYALGTMQVVFPGGSAVEVRRADFGVEIDRARLASFVEEAFRSGSPLQRAHANRAEPGPLEVPLPLRFDDERVLAWLLDRKAELDSTATDAAIDLVERRVRPERVGRRIDVYATLARLDEALGAGLDRVEVAAVEIPPRVTEADLEGVRFEHVLGWFETRYAPGKRNEDRTYNLRLTASKIDGYVVLPGETFDFNAVVGPRDEAHGYRVAPVIAQGELVDGIGGGTCQISGTLHAAAFFAGLEIVERYPHSRPSSYIKLGLDATVAYPNINYRFRNPFDFPVVLHQKVAAGVVRAEVLGPERKLTVSYFRRIDDILPFEETVRETEKLEKGERIVVQRGIPGFRATSSRLVREGAYGERTKWTERYPPTTQIVELGTGPKGTKAKRKEDTSNEYTVDEVLVITQGPTIRTPGAASDPPGGGMIEQRTPGRTGERGWMKKLGFSKDPPEPDEEDEADEAATEKNDRDAGDARAPSAKHKGRKKGNDKGSEQARQAQSGD